MRSKKTFSVVPMLILVLLFVAVGILIVYDVSTAESLSLYGDKFFVARQQLLRAFLGVIGMLACARIPTVFWKKIGIFVFGGALVLLALVLLPGIGSVISGAKRWIVIGPFPFQPSELMKMGLIFYLSTWLGKPRRFQSFLILILMVFGLIMLEPDLGSGIVVLLIALAMYFVSGKPLKHFVWLVGIGFVGILGLIIFSPYRMQRLATYVNPNSDPQGKSYHIRQITIALGNGGLFGQGLGKSRQKYQYIPEAMTDSIFAIVAEEVGFVGCGIIIFGYIYLFSQMMTRTAHLEDDEEKLIGVGIAAWIASQSLVNLGSVVALIPLTGVPLPFISYGGSSLIVTLVALGIFFGLGRSTSSKKRL